MISIEQPSYQAESVSEQTLSPVSELSLQWQRAQTFAKSFAALNIPKYSDLEAKTSATENEDVLHNPQHVALSTQAHHWQQQQCLALALRHSHTAFKLATLLYPTPLSLYNDPNVIAPEVLLNGFHLTESLSEQTFTSDPALLADVLFP